MLGLLPLKKVRDIPLPHFPALWQAVVFRNYGVVETGIIAGVLGTDEKTIDGAAADMGLSVRAGSVELWRRRGYLTVLRANWNLLNYEQLMLLCNKTEDELAFILKEDDFFGYKMGMFKPDLPQVLYSPLSEDEKQKTADIKSFLKSNFPDMTAGEKPFDFFDKYYAPVGDYTPSNPNQNERFDLRMVHTIFGTYGEAGESSGDDPYPDGLLKELADRGINAVWLHVVLYKLVSFEFEPELSAGYENRLDILRGIIKRAARFGIKLMLYLNEPRAMPPSFFEKYPHLKGTGVYGLNSLCTSTPEVRDYLRSSVSSLVKSLPGLGGVFTITMSENLTNCYSAGDNTQCPRCARRRPAEVVAEVNNIIIDAVKSENPDCRVITWLWGWGRDWKEECINLLDARAEVMANSEEKMETDIGGVKGSVEDYTMSLPGPGEIAKTSWRAAKARGLKYYAKTQINATWECSAVPYIPVPDLVEKHIRNLLREGISGSMFSWTLGGSPSINMELAGEYFYYKDGEADGARLPALCKRKFGGKYGEIMQKAFAALSTAFAEFPFHVEVVYTAPHNYGPSNLLYAEKTGRKATMIGNPWDDLDTWRGIYPRDIFIKQMDLLVNKWKAGVDIMRCALSSNDAEISEIFRYAEAAGVHFESAKNQCVYVAARDENDLETMKKTAASELVLAKRLYELCSCDSRIGFEASNHYYYTPNAILEKALNCRLLM